MLGRHTEKPLMPLTPVQTQSPRSAGRFHSVQTRMALSFGLASLAILVTLRYIGLWGVPFTRWNGRVEDFKAEADAGLQLIADLKEERLRSWLDDRRKDLAILAGGPCGVVQLQSLLNEMEHLTAKGLRGRALWTRLREQAEYQLIVSASRKSIAPIPIVAASSSPTPRAGRSSLQPTTPTWADVAGQPYFLRPARETGDFVGGTRLVGNAQEPVFYIARPLRSPRNGAVGVMVAEVQTDRALRPLLHTGEGLGTHGEALLIDGDRRILTSLKYPTADAGPPRPLQYRLETEPANRALQHQRGVVACLDYRGLPVLAAYRFLQLTPELGWGLIVKRDREELFAPLRGQIFRASMVGVLGTLLVVFAATALARNIARPAQAVARAAEQVAGGDLTARAPVVSNDEVGVLARTFNDMVHASRTRKRPWSARSGSAPWGK